jgi:mannose-6-phosphate isomerase-like protein (cupin superfamily)
MSMPTQRDASKVFQHLVDQTWGPILDVFGPTVEFLTESDEFCVLRGVVPPGVTVPLHRHGDSEVFFIISGTQQVLVYGKTGLEWHDAYAGDYVCIPGDVPHAIRNVTEEPVVALTITTARMGRFFQEIGRPVTSTLAPPTPAELEHFVSVAVSYGYILGTAEENATVGITIPGFAS